MQRIAVNSSNIASIGYDENTATLEVAFKSGGIYQYLGVPLNVYQALMSARSHGTYLNQHVVGKYRTRKIQ